MPSTSEARPGPSPHPLGDDAPTVDRLPLALRAMGAAAAVAVAWMAVVLRVALLTISPEAAPATLEEFDPDATYVLIMLFGSIATPVFAAVTGFLLMYPIPSPWRRGGLTMVAVLGGTALAMILTLVAREMVGEVGLVGLALLAAAVAVHLGRRALALAADPGAA